MKVNSHSSRTSRRLIPAGIGAAALLLSGLTALTRGDDLPAPATLDLPVPANRAMPVWIGQPQTPSTTFATMNVPVMQPDPAASLLLTVYFQEKDGGFLRIIWAGSNGAKVISDNFYENIGMANQRSLLIDASTLGGDGTLTFQCGDSALGIQRLKLEWLENKPGLAPSSVTDTLVTPSSGPTQPEQAFNGQPPPAQIAAWQNQLINVPLADAPVRIEDGVQFSLDLDSAPTTARIALQETGLAFGKHLTVWVNDQYAGTITPSVPDLTDSGYFSADAGTNYVGWRDGSFFVPVSLLKSGVNTLQFDNDADVPTGIATTAAPSTGANPPLALKNLVMQLIYQSSPPSPAPDATAPPPDSTSPAPTPEFLLGPVAPQSPALTSNPSTTSSP